MTFQTYITAIPSDNNTPAVDQPNMIIDTNSIFQWAGANPASDHYGFNDSNGALHKRTTHVVQGSDPGSASDQYVDYAKTVSGSSELFAQKDGVTTPIQLTRGLPVAGSKGVTYLPGGLLLQWMIVSISGSSASNTFQVPFTSALYSVTIGPQQNASMWVSASSLTNVTISRNGSGGSGCWVMAIGV